MTSSAPSLDSPRGGRRLLVLLPAVCALLLAAFAFQRIAARADAHKVLIDNPDGSRSTLDLSALAGKELLDPATGRREALSFKGGPTLLVFLSAGDCPNCLEERAVWGRLARAEGARLRVVGLLVRTSPEEARAFLKAYRLPFPVYLDDRQQLERGLQLPQSTPFKVLLSAEGGVLLADGPSPERAAQEEFGRRVEATLRAAGGR